MTVKPLGFGQVQLFSLRCKVRVLEPVSYSQLTKDRAAYDSDKDVANHIYSPTNLIRKISSVGSEVNWMEPSLQPWNSRFLKPQGSNRVCNALHLLQTEPATAIQCKREDFIQKIKDEQGEGCNIVGTLEVNKVAGNFHFAPGKSFHQANLHVLELLAFQMDNYNITHRINKLSFGRIQHILSIINMIFVI
ncbi:hypothetical protein POM88_018149 [Heracleum sosnowskyi]|uniref:Endoplasmic reticulum vesicle transporter C-terminal domain-containing protein n=1 Tax=Heracleum sosnowskyi TaxID=360622 RepID=A0AAD8MYV5_9APIA|nr:hypothetical protein POM88_018149 [Heracleum sosnowskyi]